MRVMSLVLLVGVGCDEKEEEDVATGIAALGAGSHDIGSVTVTEIGTDDDGLNIPRDLEFNPDVEGELWVVNQADDSVTIFDNAGNCFQHPRRGSCANRTRPKLFNQNHVVTLNVPGQDRDCVAALEQLAANTLSPAAIKTAVFQRQRIHPKMPLKHGFAFDNVNIRIPVEQ